jgi:hypothetical protein
MPYGWTKVSTPPDLHDVIGDPDKFKDRAGGLVRGAGATVDRILWEKPGGPAYIITHVEAQQNADEVFKKLKDAIGDTTRLYDTDEIKHRP